LAEIKSKQEEEDAYLFMKNNQIKLGDTVKLPKSLKSVKYYPKDLRGIVVNINGGYYDVAPLGCWWLSEFYESELKLDEKWRGTKKELKEFRRKFNKFYEYMIESKGNA
jgi:hypothetical protein